MKSFVELTKKMFWNCMYRLVSKLCLCLFPIGPNLCLWTIFDCLSIYNPCLTKTMMNGEDKGLKNGKKGKIVMYVHADEGLGKRKSRGKLTKRET